MKIIFFNTLHEQFIEKNYVHELKSIGKKYFHELKTIFKTNSLLKKTMLMNFSILP
jgi:hypothetical protein